MYLYRSLLLLVALAIVAIPAQASKEGLLKLTSFSLESGGIGESGQIKVSGTQASTGITSLKIRAFGQEFLLNPAQLRQLRGVGVNGLQISYEHGYRELGGRTIYVVLSAGFTSGIVKRKFLVVTESGSIKVADKL